MQVSFVMRLIRHVVSVRADICVEVSFWLMKVMVDGVCVSGSRFGTGHCVVDRE